VFVEPIKFFFDEHVPQAAADGLRRRGVDVLTALEAGREGFPDNEQLVFAAQEGRVLVTMDADFLVLDAQGVPHAGIAYAHQGSP
jgi:predicted nuclease of predicted toxin-antitoxin system